MLMQAHIEEKKVEPKPEVSYLISCSFCNALYLPQYSLIGFYEK